MRRVSVARDDEHGPQGNEPYITDSGLAVPGVDSTGNTAGPDGDLQDEQAYEIDYIVRAERIGNRYRVFIKWVGYDEVTYRWRDELVKETANDELLREIEKAVELARARHRSEHGHLEEEVEDETPVEPNVITDAQPDTRTLRRQRREGRFNLVMAHDPLSTTLADAVDITINFTDEYASTGFTAWCYAADDYAMPFS